MSQSFDETKAKVPPGEIDWSKAKNRCVRVYYSSKEDDRIERKLPISSNWNHGRVSTTYRTEEEREEGTISVEKTVYYPNTHVETIEKGISRVLSNKKTFDHYNVTWYYKNGYYNPWIMKERLRLFLKSIDMEHEGTYRDKKYVLAFSNTDWYQYISLKYESEDAEAFESLAGIFESFFQKSTNLTIRISLRSLLKSTHPLKWKLEITTLRVLTMIWAVL